MQCSQWWEGYNSAVQPVVGYNIAARGVMEGPAIRMCVWGAVNRHVLGVRLWCNDVVYCCFCMFGHAVQWGGKYLTRCCY